MALINNYFFQFFNNSSNNFFNISKIGSDRITVTNLAVANSEYSTSHALELSPSHFVRKVDLAKIKICEFFPPENTPIQSHSHLRYGHPQVPTRGKRLGKKKNSSQKRKLGASIVSL